MTANNYPELVARELLEARAKHSHNIVSPHEAYAVVKEEMDEFWGEVKAQHADPVKLLKGLTHISAMCQRAAEDLELQEKALVANGQVLKGALVKYDAVVSAVQQMHDALDRIKPVHDASGRQYGHVKAGVWHVTRPLFRKLNAFCLDDEALDSAIRQGATHILLTEEGVGRLYSVKLSVFWANAFPVHEGQGAQHGMLVSLWWPGSEPAAKQMELALAVKEDEKAEGIGP